MPDLDALRALREDRPLPPAGARLAIDAGRGRIRRRRTVVAASGSAVTCLAALLVAAAGPSPRAAQRLDQLDSPESSSGTPRPYASANPTGSAGPEAAAGVDGVAHVVVTGKPKPSPSSEPEPSRAGDTRPAGGTPAARTPDVERGECVSGSASVETDGGNREVWAGSRNVDGKGRSFTFVLHVERPSTNVQGDGTLSFPTEQEAEYVVRQGGREVYRWSDGQDIAGRPHDLAFRPGQCRTWELAWPAVDRYGRAVPSGRYEVEIASTARELSGSRHRVPVTVD